VPGPVAIAENNDTQLFGYTGENAIAFGEFTFDTRSAKPSVIFRLIDEFGNIIEEHILPYHKLTPP
jgi:alkaline phosphatase D